MPITADAASPVLAALTRAIGAAVLLVGAGLALMFAFAAALVVGVMIFGAALVLRFFPRRAAKAGPDVLEARRTPDGWVVEAEAQPKA